jgi:hypothetical protein
MYTKGAVGDVNTDNPAVNTGGGSFDVVFQRPTDAFGNPVVTAGRVTCGNSGSKSKPSPGIQVVDVANFFSFFNPITVSNLAITKNDIHGGVADVLTGDQFYALTNAAITPCPNAGWTVLDAVACSADMVVTLKKDSTILEKVKETCSLDACQTLGFNSRTGIFDTRQYACGAATPVSP